MADTPEQFFSEMPTRVDKEKVKDINATYQWKLSGDNGGDWYAKFNNGDVDVQKGEAESPNVTIVTGAQDWLDIVNGKQNAQMAFLTGKLKIQGDMSLAMKLQNLT